MTETKPLPERWRRADCAKMVEACRKLEAEAVRRKNPFMVSFWRGCAREWAERQARGYD